MAGGGGGGDDFVQMFSTQSTKNLIGATIHEVYYIAPNIVCKQYIYIYIFNYSAIAESIEICSTTVKLENQFSLAERLIGRPLSEKIALFSYRMR